MNPFDDLPILAEAEWPRAGATPLRVRVHASPMVYGAGDFEDPADSAEELAPVFIISAERPDAPGQFETVAQGLASIDEVRVRVEQAFPGARWLKSFDAA